MPNPNQNEPENQADQERAYEAKLAQAQRVARSQAPAPTPAKQAAPEEKEEEEKKGPSGLGRGLTEIAGKGIKQAAGQYAKKIAKKALWTAARAIAQAIWSFLVATFPWSLIVIAGTIFLVLLIFGFSALFGYFRENPSQALKIAGEAVGNIVLKGLGVKD